MTIVDILIPLWKVMVDTTNLMYKILGSRTHNIVGEFAEHLVCDVFGGTLVSPSTKAYDVLLPDGTRIQVKARKLSGKYKYQETISDFHSWAFDVLVVVLFNDNGSLKKVFKLDSVTARGLASKLSNGRERITLNKQFEGSATDITREFCSYGI